MIIRHIPEKDNRGVKRTERLDLPIGKWAVFVENVRYDHDADMKHSDPERFDHPSLYSECTSLYVIDGPDSWAGTAVNRVTVSRVMWGKSEISPGEPRITTERVLFYSDRPFVVRVSHDDIYGHSWAYTATLVGPGGLTQNMPEMRMPEFVKSAAVPAQNWNLMRPGKWCRLRDLAELVGWNPYSVLVNHANDVDSDHELFGSDVHFASADSAADMAALEHYESTSLTVDQLKGLDLDKVWVRKHFALVVLYLHHLGWTQKLIESEA